MDERRSAPRGETPRSATIIFHDGRSQIACKVRDLSVAGACLEVASSADVPQTFELKFEGEAAAQTCSRRWATADRIGVTFEATSLLFAKAWNVLPGLRPVPQRIAPPLSPRDIPAWREGEFQRLRIALDEIPLGIVLLDAELRAKLINRAYRRMWRLPDDKADGNPAFVALMYHGRDTRAYEIPDEDLPAYVAERVAMVRSGDPTPRDIRLSDGEVLRFQCTVMPAGGRMLSYTAVTDIVRRSDELASLNAALDNIKEGVVVLDSDLKVVYLNRIIKNLWKIGDAFTATLPAYGDMIRIGRRIGLLPPFPEGDEAFIAKTLALIRVDDPQPVDFRVRDRMIRGRCAPAANGGHIITFDDISDLIERAQQLQTIANTDELTGLHNRRHFMAAARSEWERFQRYHRPLSLVSFDIDHFKKINDAYGHDTGDDAIRHIANLARGGRSGCDVVARIGGEEFMLLLPETALAQAAIVAERLRNEIAQNPCVSSGKRVPMTVSIGVAEAAIGMPGIHELIKRADNCLYRAKSLGRNRIEIARPDQLNDELAAE